MMNLGPLHQVKNPVTPKTANDSTVTIFKNCIDSCTNKGKMTVCKQAWTTIITRM